jgi:predicted Zn-dependent protease
MITTAILDQCRTDDELALVIGHEMSHNILHHPVRLTADGVEPELLPVSEAESAEMREMEEEADRLAVRISSVAGYDLSQAVPFIGRLLARVERNGLAADTHPPSVRRLALLKMAVAQVTGRRARLQRARSPGNTSPIARVSGKIYTMPTVPVNAGLTTLS